MNDIIIKKIGIFGGTGFIGSNIVLYLNNNLNKLNNKTYTYENKSITFQIDEIRIFFSKTRWNNLIKDIESPAFKFIKVNIFNKDELIKKTEGLDLIINSSGLVSFSPKDIEKLWEVNVIGAKNILQAAISNNVKRFIHLSSISILNLYDTTHYLNENDIGINGFKRNFHSFSSIDEIFQIYNSYADGNKKILKKLKNPYADTKLAGFYICKDLASKSNIEFVNILPGTVLGRGDNNISILKLVYNVDKNFIFGLLPGFSSFIDSYDLAKGIFNSIIYGKNLESYIISGDIENNITYSELVKKLNKSLNKIRKTNSKKLFIKLPKLITYPISFLAEKILQSKDLTINLIKSAYIKSKIEIEKAKKDLQFIPETHIDKSIENLCMDYIEYDIKEVIKNKKFYFFAKNYVVDPWVKRKAIIFINGEENIYHSKNRIYVVNHPCTFDIHTIINTSIDNFYIPVDHNAFKIPFFGYLLNGCGLPKVYPKENKHILPMITKIIKNGYPVFNSIRSGDVTLDKEERIRTGAAVFADLNKADLIPYHIYIEKSKKHITYAPGFDLKLHPYSYYKDAIIYINILPPLKWEDYHKDNMTKEDYSNIMKKIDDLFIEMDKKMDEFFEKNKENLDKIERKGGSKIKLKY